MKTKLKLGITLLVIGVTSFAFKSEIEQGRFKYQMQVF